MLLAGRYCRTFNLTCTKRYFKSIRNNLIIFSKKYIRANLYLLLHNSSNFFLHFPMLNTKAINYLPVRV